MESPVAQWLEHPTRSRRVVGSNPIWNSDFFPSFHLMLKNLIMLLNKNTPQNHPLKVTASHIPGYLSHQIFHNNFITEINQANDSQANKHLSFPV